MNGLTVNDIGILYYKIYRILYFANVRRNFLYDVHLLKMYSLNRVINNSL